MVENLTKQQNVNIKPQEEEESKNTEFFAEHNQIFGLILTLHDYSLRKKLTEVELETKLEKQRLLYDERVNFHLDFNTLHKIG